MSARRRWMLVAGAAAVAVAAWWPRSEAPLALPAAAHSPPAAPIRVAETAAAVAVVEPASAALPACPHQAMDLTRATGAERACVAATRTRQSGSLRTYLLEPEGVSAWRLVVEVASGQVLSARLMQPASGPRPALAFACDNAACAGIRLGQPDAQGVRTLALEDAALRALPPGAKWRRQLPPSAGPAAAASVAPADPSLEVVRLHARFTVPPDSQAPGLACNTATLRIVEAEGGALTDFCPMGGAGFELGEAGRTRFVFRSLDGQSVAVTLAPDGSVEQVSLGRWSCVAPACGGVAVQAVGDSADPLVERRFAFSGTTLADTASRRQAASLNGNLVVPAQQ